jgi:hypothetical protein
MTATTTPALHPLPGHPHHDLADAHPLPPHHPITDEKPRPRRTQADKWALNYAAAKQFYERERHLRVPRQHVERIAVPSADDCRDGESGGDQEEREIKLGAWIGNQRSRAATLSPEQIEQLSAIGMRWA